MRFTFGDFVLDCGTRQLLRGGAELHVSPKELALLKLLLRARPRAVSRTRLRAAIWPDAHVGETSLHVLVSQLRATLGDNVHQPRWSTAAAPCSRTSPARTGRSSMASGSSRRVPWRTAPRSVWGGVRVSSSGPTRPTRPRPKRAWTSALRSAGCARVDRATCVDAAAMARVCGRKPLTPVSHQA